MDFKQAKQQADENKSLKQATLAENKTPFCIMRAEYRESIFNGQTNPQYYCHIVYLKDGKRQSSDVYISGKYLMNILENLDLPCHNVFLFLENKAYSMDQHSGQCPCQHGTNGHVSRETTAQEEIEDISSILQEYGFEDTTEVEPISNKQKQAITVISKALKQEVPDMTGWSSDLADEYLAEMKKQHAGVSK